MWNAQDNNNNILRDWETTTQHLPTIPINHTFSILARAKC